MKCFLVGYPGSRKVRRASEYLTKKYLPGYRVLWAEHIGSIGFWSDVVRFCLERMDDKEIIFALDDYLLAGPIGDLPKLGDAVCAKLCDATPEENESYPVTTQYTLWNREYLVGLLSKTTTPWDFEMNGSRIFKEEGKKMIHAPILKYYANSSLSKRWEGVRLDGVGEEDIKAVQELIK